MIRALSAKFVTSAPSIKQAPEFAMSEVVFLGRSNVGKSSLINALANHAGLAKSSSTPGKTRLINFFEVDFEEERPQNLADENLDTEQNLTSQISCERFKIMFVDLPGFGYAKVAKSMHAEWKKSLDEFLKFRTSIRLFVHLIDARHFELDIDAGVSEYIASFLRADQQVINIYTKADKLNQSAKSALLKRDHAGVLVSTLKKSGIDRARQIIVDRALGRE